MTEGLRSLVHEIGVTGSADLLLLRVRLLHSPVCGGEIGASSPTDLLRLRTRLSDSLSRSLVRGDEVELPRSLDLLRLCTGRLDSLGERLDLDLERDLRLGLSLKYRPGEFRGDRTPRLG